MTTAAGRPVSRRSLFALGGGAAVLAGVGRPGAIAATDAPGPRQVTLVEGTNIAATASPDGRKIAFDLFGVLWLVGIDGGSARRLTEDSFEVGQPDWSPDGRRIVFQSYQDGQFHLWVIDAAGGAPRQLTTGPQDDREPRFSPDGGRIAYSSDRDGGYGVRILDLASGVATPVPTGPGDAFEPAWSPDGRSLVVTVDKTRIALVELAGGGVQTLASAPSGGDRQTAASVSSAAFTPDGATVIYTAIENGKAELRDTAGRRIVTGEDVFPFRVSWLPGGDFIYTAGGAIRRRPLNRSTSAKIPFDAVATVATAPPRAGRRDFDAAGSRPVIGIGAPALSPDGGSILFRALNDIYLLRMGDVARPLFKDRFHKLDPAWSPDGRRVAYSTDRGGTLDLWVHDLLAGETVQLTHFDGAAVSPAWSRDGRSIAFLNQNGALHQVDVATGTVRRLYDDLWEPGKPSWSPDGRTIVLAAFKPYSARFREGLSEILTVDVETGKGRYRPLAPHRSLGTRGDDGPVWAPDGSAFAYVFASRLWVAPVGPDGEAAGPPRALNDEVTDAPTWSGDSRRILYLSAGRLRLISAVGGEPETITHGLTWAAARSPGRLVVEAGRLWDGTNPTVRDDVDIVVEGTRITGIVARGGGPGQGEARRVDARNSMVIPGLIDMHTHRQMQGYGYGDRDGRLWLSLGVTATRSPGGPAYHTVEDQESIQSGARLGPRYFATGEAIDGSRIYYNFMRPVTETGQMALELQRAEALSYDLIKTYVRLSAERQGEVVAWAHARGLPVTSHYAYPALNFGIDGMEHMGATSRTGYSRTISALGAVYQDVGAIFRASRASRTPTLFIAQVLYGEDRSLVEDPRIRALYPPWEYARLVARADQLARQDRTAMLENLARQVAEIRDTVRAGGVIVAGTDSPIDFNAVSLHMNLRGMVRFGLTPYEALVTATRASGVFLGQPIGVVRPGAFADLAIVDGDPLTKIEDAARVRAVVRNGSPLTMDEILGPFREHAQTTAQNRRPAFVCTAEPEYWWHGPDYVSRARSSCCDGDCDAGWSRTV